MAKPPKTTTLSALQAGRTIRNQAMGAVHHVPALQPKSRGAWSQEADKVAWTDRLTGLQCIIRRSEKGFLCGFVAVSPDHPLFGFRADAVPSGIVSVHGGLNYASPCDEQAPEEIAICHVHDGQAGHGSDRAGQWWFGFSCNQMGDVIPGDGAHRENAEQLGIEQEYRDERYLFDQCTNLAAQLAGAAVGRGDIDKARVDRNDDKEDGR